MPVTSSSSGTVAGPGVGGSADGGSPTSLTERRKAATRTEIARTAAALFVAHGVRDTRAEDIARAAGVAPRTFYRYFATKEESVAPLFAAGARQWVEATRLAPEGMTLPEALVHGTREALALDDPANAESLEWVRALLRLADDNPALRSVWNDAYHASETDLAAALAERYGGGSGGPGGSGGSGGSGDRSAGSGGAGSDRSGAGPHTLPLPSPLPLRLVAGIAATTVRIAVETWAAGDAPADGPEGPAALAARCVESLSTSPWSTT